MATDSQGPELSSVGEATIITLPEDAFYALAWVIFAACTVAFGIRLYIRHACFHRLLVDDYLMLIALCMLGTVAVLIQVYVRYGYQLQAFQQGDMSHFGPHSFQDYSKAFMATGVSVIVEMIGIFIVKLTFLLFFRRLGAKVDWFTRMWWGSCSSLSLLRWPSSEFRTIAVSSEAPTIYSLVVAATALSPCSEYSFLPSSPSRQMLSPMFSVSPHLSFVPIELKHAAPEEIQANYAIALVLCLPVIILWRSRIEIRKKIILTFVFGLASLTIAITIIRGSIFHNAFDADGRITKSSQSITFTWFWWYCEFGVSFLISCIVSFRSLFVQRRNHSLDRQEKQRQGQGPRSGGRLDWRARIYRFHDSVVDTAKTLDGWHDGDSGTTLAMHNQQLPDVPPGLMTVDFNDDGNWKKKTREGQVDSSLSGERPVSARSLIETQAPRTH
ncbi:hypothetical protein PG997_013628 [Apiospora hydei]|uniref:Rhodopsin domain-containing protein n=1 Tax=Apiospora hydei TaxID=1337664 RepID=A0ABR1V6Q8_9PEZI